MGRTEQHKRNNTKMQLQQMSFPIPRLPIHRNSIHCISAAFHGVPRFHSIRNSGKSNGSSNHVRFNTTTNDTAHPVSYVEFSPEISRKGDVWRIFHGKEISGRDVTSTRVFPIGQPTNLIARNGGISWFHLAGDVVKYFVVAILNLDLDMGLY
jgi:hypothetical protein